LAEFLSNLPPLPTIQLGRWRHYKGGEYEVLGVVRHSETLEPLVLYRPLYPQPDGRRADPWVRPFAMFQEVGTFEGKVQARFRRIEPD
jgi:hypothetical protein